MTRPTKKDEARARRAEKLAAALRANLRRRKQEPAAPGDGGSEGEFRRRDEALPSLTGKRKE